MDFCILGPLAGVDDDGNALTFGGRGDRALLATLLVQAGRIVPVDVLADEFAGAICIFWEHGARGDAG